MVDGSARYWNQKGFFSTIVVCISFLFMGCPTPGKDKNSGAGGASSGGSANITAKVALNSISITPMSLSLAKGTTQQLTATGLFSDQTTKDITSLVEWKSNNGGVSGQGLVTAQNVGTMDVTAELNGVSAMLSVTIKQAALTSISITPPVASLALGISQQFTATGFFTDGTHQDVTTLVTWTSQDSAIAEVSSGAAGLVSSESAGVTQVHASFNGVQDIASLTVTPAVMNTLEVYPVNPSFAKGTQLQLSAIARYTDNTTQDVTNQDVTNQVTWVSESPSVASVVPASFGLFAGADVGSASVSANMNSLTGNTVIKVLPAVLAQMDIQPTNISVAQGYQQQFSVNGIYSDGSVQDLTSQAIWTSSDPAIAQVSNANGSHGLADAFKIGSVNVSAALGSVTASTVFSVTPAVLRSLSIQASVNSLPKGLTTKLSAIGTYSDGSTADVTEQVTWASSDNSKVSVSNAAGVQGLLTAVNEGSASVSATSSTIQSVSLFHVTTAVLEIVNVSPASLSLAKGLTHLFTASGVFSDHSVQDISSQVSWSLSNPSANAPIASVSNVSSNRGLVTALDVGAIGIIASVGSISGRGNLTVTTAVLTSLAVVSAAPTVNNGKTVQLSATGVYSDQSNQALTSAVTWTSSNPAIATVSNASGTQGLVTAIAVGSVTLTAAQGSISANVTIDVTQAPQPPLVVSYSANTFNWGFPGTDINVLVPSVQGGAPTSYAVSPALPKGLTLNTVTGQISGRPTAVASAKNYTISASNSLGRAQAVLNLRVFNSKTASGARKITMTSTSFVDSASSTNITKLNVGNTLYWINDSSVKQSAVSSDRPEQFTAVSNYKKNGKQYLTLNKAGAFNYANAINSSMTGQIISSP